MRVNLQCLVQNVRLFLLNSYFHFKETYFWAPLMLQAPTNLLQLSPNPTHQRTATCCTGNNSHAVTRLSPEVISRLQDQNYYLHMMARRPNWKYTIIKIFCVDIIVYFIILGNADHNDEGIVQICHSKHTLSIQACGLDLALLTSNRRQKTREGEGQ